jgi:tetratricopeptide (TPR) repeat protein
MSPGRPGARRTVILTTLAALSAGLVATLGLLAGAYTGRAKSLDWWIVGPISAVLFISAALAPILALRAGQPPESAETSPPLPSEPKTKSRPPTHRRHLAWRPGRGDAPRQLPAGVIRFYGRSAELAALATEYEKARPAELPVPSSAAAFGQITDAHSRSHPKRPTIILVHGMPGVGKTALAVEFAHQIKKNFPDGQLYANLGIVGERRTSADILQDFLTDLGIRDREMPDDEGERANLFRSLTIRKRILVVLIAARGFDQVDLLRPTGPRCAVIITSRFSLGSELGAIEYHLTTPESAEAAGLLRRYAGMQRGEAIAAVTEIAHYCGSLPYALCSAGEQIGSRHVDPEGLAVRLRRKETRLATLRYGERDIEDRITREYNRLPAAEQRALRLLTLIESPTFESWVLAPLMNVSTGDAQSLAASLARYHLLMDAGHRVGTGLARYSMHPLVWLVAKERLDADEHPDDKATALRRLDAAFLSAARSVLIRIEPALAGRSTWRSASEWTQSEEIWLPAILKDLEHWIQTEYRQLLRAIALAQEAGQWSLCSRIAAHLGACVADGLRPEESERAFEAARQAAELEKDGRGCIEVLLAHGSFLAAVERYEKAFQILGLAISSADRMNPPLPAAVMRLLKASAHRRQAEAWLQMGAYDMARRELQTAAGEIQAGEEVTDTPREKARIALLTAETSTWLDPSSWLDRRAYDEALAAPPDYGAYVRATLGLAEQARRQRQWDKALQHLDTARSHNYGDARQAAAIQYRTARLVLQQGREGPARNRADTGYRAADYASDAARIFRDMDDEVGMIRANALLVRALVLARCYREARVLAEDLEHELTVLGESNPAFGRLQARVQRCRAEVMLAFDEPERARVLLSQAISLFEDDRDLHSIAATHVALATPLADRGQPLIAQAKLLEAEDYYSQCGDNSALRTARALRKKIARREKVRSWRNWNAAD